MKWSDIDGIRWQLHSPKRGDPWWVLCVHYAGGRWEWADFGQGSALVNDPKFDGVEEPDGPDLEIIPTPPEERKRLWEEWHEKMDFVESLARASGLLPDWVTSHSWMHCTEVLARADLPEWLVDELYERYYAAGGLTGDWWNLDPIDPAV